MTVSTTARSQQFTLDGGTAAFTFTFRTLVSAPTNIKCVATVGGVDTTLTYTTDYTVAVNSNGVGGTVTLVDAAGVGSGTLTVYRETTNTQTSDYDDYNQFPANTLENDLDIRTMIAQEAAEASARAMSLPISLSGVSAELPSPEANKVLGWNGTALAIVNYAPNTDAYKLSYTRSFTNSDLTAGTLTVNHNIGQAHVIIVVFDNNDLMIIPDEVTEIDTNSLTLDINSYGAISGTWNLRVMS